MLTNWDISALQPLYAMKVLGFEWYTEENLSLPVTKPLLNTYVKFAVQTLATQHI